MTTCKECSKRGSCQKPLSTTGDYKSCADFEQKKITRLEKIKNMSADEIATEIYNSVESYCECCFYRGHSCMPKSCIDGIKEWLMQEVE